MTDRGIVVLGIPIPSSSPVFLSIVAVHVAAAIVCVVAGVVAMLAAKRGGRHPIAGSVYYWSLLVVSLSMTVLSIIRWPEDIHLLILGVLSFGAAVVGRAARRRQKPGWLPLHITGMSVSYIVLLTAFYVDNGPHLPLWRALPPLAYWIVPSLVGVPILIRVLKRHPLIVGSSRSPETTS
jgi:uncharacterized membrane protein